MRQKRIILLIKHIRWLLLIILLNSLLIDLCSGQNKELKFSFRAGQFDNLMNVVSLDDSRQWESGFISRLPTFSLEYQKPLNMHMSFKSILAYSIGRFNHYYSSSNENITMFYYNQYLNVGIISNFHFGKKENGLMIGLGPSIYILTSHHLSEKAIKNGKLLPENESLLRDKLNSVPSVIQFELSYSTKVFEHFNKSWGLEVGYTPAIKLISFFNEKTKSIFLPYGFPISLNMRVG